MTWVKLCGITSADEVRACSEAGADALGFVVDFPADVPWNLSIDEAERLMGQVRDGVERVVVAGDDADLVAAQLERLRPHAVQLHADEPPEATRRIAAVAHAVGCRVMKALRFAVESGDVLSAHRTHPDPVAAAGEMLALGVDEVLLDSVSRTQAAGTGRTIDFAVARRIRDAVAAPVVLAGGLTPHNVALAIEAVGPHGVDVISGVETRRRLKDPARVRAFIANARGTRREP